MTIRLSLNHPTLMLPEKVNEICTSFLTQHGFNYFLYLRCYDDGSISLLVNNAEPLKHFLELDFPVFSSYKNEHNLQHSYWFFWDEELPWLPVKIVRDYHKLHHGLTFVRRQKRHYDMIAVALPHERLNPASFYMGKQKAMENFIGYFDREYKDLLAIVTKNRIFLPEANRDMNYQNLCLKNNTRIPIMGAYGSTYITGQEVACVRLLTHGYRLKEIANHLELSPRTVETYISRVKERSGTRKRSDLLSFVSNCP